MDSWKLHLCCCHFSLPPLPLLLHHSCEEVATVWTQILAAQPWHSSPTTGNCACATTGEWWPGRSSSGVDTAPSCLGPVQEKPCLLPMHPGHIGLEPRCFSLHLEKVASCCFSSSCYLFEAGLQLQSSFSVVIVYSPGREVAGIGPGSNKRESLRKLGTHFWLISQYVWSPKPVKLPKTCGPRL